MAHQLVMIKTQIPHVYRIDLEGDGMAHECAVMRIDEFGNVLYLKLNELDFIDRERLGKILRNRYINQLPLWDVMSQTTLKNNMNALEYFHQMVRGITSSGTKYVPRVGVSGYRSINHTIAEQRQLEAQAKAQVEAHAAEQQQATEAAETADKPKRGRPAKA